MAKQRTDDQQLALNFQEASFPAPPPAAAIANATLRASAPPAVPTHSNEPAAASNEGQNLPVPTPLRASVEKGTFGVDENEDPIEPSPEEVAEISRAHGERLAATLQELAAVNELLAQRRNGDRASLLQAKDRLTCQVQSVFALYAEDFGEPAARALQAWAENHARDDPHGREQGQREVGNAQATKLPRRRKRATAVASQRLKQADDSPQPPASDEQPVQGMCTPESARQQSTTSSVVGSVPLRGTNHGGRVRIATANEEATGQDKHARLHEKVDEALTRLAGSLEAGHSETLKAWLKMMNRFHSYSFGNQMLIAWQRPEATQVAGFHAWKKFNRFVNKGEKGIMILAPVTRVVGTAHERDDAGRERETKVRRIINTKVVYVFDVAQTSGDPLPEFAQVLGEPADDLPKLRQLVTDKGILLEYAKHLPLPGAFGCSVGGTIIMREGLSPAQEFKTLVHELAHELLHKEGDRSSMTKTVKETEAEAVAFVVSDAIGLDCTTRSSDYIQLYRGDKKTLFESLQRIRSVAGEILGVLVPSRQRSHEDE